MSSLAVRRLHRLPPTSAPFLSQAALTSRRSASHHAHEHHEADTFEYRPEGFANPFWRNVIIASVLGYGLYQVAPSPVSVDGHKSSITRFLASQIPDDNIWKERNAMHLVLSKNAADDKWLTGSAQKPAVHRFRYTGVFDDASPHMVVVGEQDNQDFEVKSNKLTKL